MEALNVEISSYQIPACIPTEIDARVVQRTWAEADVGQVEEIRFLRGRFAAHLEHVPFEIQCLNRKLVSQATMPAEFVLVFVPNGPYARFPFHSPLRRVTPTDFGSMVGTRPSLMRVVDRIARLIEDDRFMLGRETPHQVLPRIRFEEHAELIAQATARERIGSGEQGIQIEKDRLFRGMATCRGFPNPHNHASRDEEGQGQSVPCATSVNQDLPPASNGVVARVRKFLVCRNGAAGTANPYLDNTRLTGCALAAR